jgi:hypothetical protein
MTSYSDDANAPIREKQVAASVGGLNLLSARQFDWDMPHVTDHDWR